MMEYSPIEVLREIIRKKLNEVYKAGEDKGYHSDEYEGLPDTDKFLYDSLQFIMDNILYIFQKD